MTRFDLGCCRPAEAVLKGLEIGRTIGIKRRMIVSLRYSLVGTRTENLPKEQNLILAIELQLGLNLGSTQAAPVSNIAQYLG